MLEIRRHRIFKLKIGLRGVDADVAHVLAIKRALGDRASVRVDVNQAWSETDAVRGIARLEAGGVDLVEQPVKARNTASLARLARRFDVALMADEALHGPEDALALARGDAADVYAVKIAQSGGLMPALEVAAIARLAGIGLYGGTMLEGGIGTAATAHVCSTFAELAWDTELFGPLLLTEEVLREPLVYRDFELEVPTGPGLGVEIDPDRLRSLQRK
jgi:muconate cycloisomerase